MTVRYDAFPHTLAAAPRPESQSTYCTVLQRHTAQGQSHSNTLRKTSAVRLLYCTVLFSVCCTAVLNFAPRNLLGAKFPTNSEPSPLNCHRTRTTTIGSPSLF
jgi:hypothetical protein